VPIVKRLERYGIASKIILEIGANANGLARFLNQRPAAIIAVDISLDSLREARLAQHILPVMADAAALPFRDKGIDVCACVDTYEHLPHEKRRPACTEIIRVLQMTDAQSWPFPPERAPLKPSAGFARRTAVTPAKQSAGSKSTPRWDCPMPMKQYAILVRRREADFASLMERTLRC